MQPHSMCAVALAGYMWNRPETKRISSCSMEVEYRRQGLYRRNIYRLSDITVSPDDREIKFRIIRDGGGIACTITIRRSTVKEGSAVSLSHSQNHISGLREVFSLYKHSISGGMHYNSRRYRAFSGTISSDRKKVTLRCEVKQSDGSFKEIEYKLSMR